MNECSVPGPLPNAVTPTVAVGILPRSPPAGGGDGATSSRDDGSSSSSRRVPLEPTGRDLMPRVPLPAGIIGAALLFSLGGYNSGAAPAPPTAAAPPPGQPRADRTDVAGVPNYAAVDAGVHRSGRPTAEGFGRLRVRGVRTVLNLEQFHDERREVEAAGLRYVHCPSTAGFMTPGHVRTLLRIINDPANQPILVHCYHGSDRTGLLVAAYRLQHGWAAGPAIDELRSFGFHGVYFTIPMMLRRMEGMPRDADERTGREARSAATRPAPAPCPPPAAGENGAGCPPAPSPT